MEKIEDLCRGLYGQAEKLLNGSCDNTYKHKYGFKYDEIEFLDSAIRDYVLPRLITKRNIKKKEPGYADMYIMETKKSMTKREGLRDINIIIDGFKEWQKEDEDTPTYYKVNYTKVNKAKKLFSELGHTF